MPPAQRVILVLLVASGLAGCGSSGTPKETSAHRPPLLQVPGAPASAAQAAALLRPGDLGPAWRYRTTPAVEMKPEITPPPNRATGETSRAQVMLWVAHWNGTRWQDDADVIEYAVTYATRADARDAVHGSGWPPVKIGGHTVWLDQPHGTHGSAAPAGAVFAAGPTTALQFVIGHGADAAPGTPSTRAILRAAVRRAFEGS